MSSCEHGNKQGSVIGRPFVELLNYLLQKDLWMDLVNLRKG